MRPSIQFEFTQCRALLILVCSDAEVWCVSSHVSRLDVLAGLGCHAAVGTAASPILAPLHGSPGQTQPLHVSQCSAERKGQGDVLRGPPERPTALPRIWCGITFCACRLLLQCLALLLLCRVASGYTCVYMCTEDPPALVCCGLCCPVAAVALPGTHATGLMCWQCRASQVLLH